MNKTTVNYYANQSIQPNRYCLFKNNRGKFILWAVKSWGHFCAIRVLLWKYQLMALLSAWKRYLCLSICNWQALLTFDMFWLGSSISSSCHYKQISRYTCLVNCGFAIYFSPIGFFKSIEKVFCPVPFYSFCSFHSPLLDVSPSSDHLSLFWPWKRRQKWKRVTLSLGSPLSDSCCTHAAVKVLLVRREWLCSAVRHVLPLSHSHLRGEELDMIFLKANTEWGSRKPVRSIFPQTMHTKEYWENVIFLLSSCSLGS